MNLLNEADGARVSTRRRVNPNLGLIYGIHIDESDVATIDMTLTSAACPLTDVIEDQAKTATDGLVQDLRINWVWMPPWGPDKITDDGRDQLRALGFNV
ncbi:metal-sulfur cluster assembly factor [Kitasatospora sp. NPDC006786]|uniref:metal-sulfur cluster assembly factor n=1 Tax=unclassified Kitasatospora TaxID=2633591 RepID=UPI0033DA275F